MKKQKPLQLDMIDETITIPEFDLFPDVRLDDVLRFDGSVLTAFCSAKGWQDPVSPAWLGAMLCALAAASGPRLNLVFPDGMTVSPTFNVILGLAPKGSLGFYRRILNPIQKLQNALQPRQSSFRLLSSSINSAQIRRDLRDSVNGGILVVNQKTSLLHGFIEAQKADQGSFTEMLKTHSLPKKVSDSRQSPWDGSVNTLLTCDRHRLYELAGTSMFAAPDPVRTLVLPDDYPHFDIPCGGDFAIKGVPVWEDLIYQVMDVPKLWAIEHTMRVKCPQEAIGWLHLLRHDLEDSMKLIDQRFQPFLTWLPDLAASLGLIKHFSKSCPTPKMDPEDMRHATTITRWLANCHFRGLQEVMGPSTITPKSDLTERDFIASGILNLLMQNGPMKPRDISRCFNRVDTSVRNLAMEKLLETKSVAWKEDGRFHSQW